MPESNERLAASGPATRSKGEAWKKGEERIRRRSTRLDSASRAREFNARVGERRREVVVRKKKGRQKSSS